MQELKNLLSAKQNVVITTHVNPDGDAIGSQISLGASLEGIGKDVFLINEDGCPDNLKFLKGLLYGIYSFLLFVLDFHEYNYFYRLIFGKLELPRKF